MRTRLAELEVRPVLTAHPTEATRKAVLTLQSRIADALLAREHAAPDERRQHESAIEPEVELLWLTAGVVPEALWPSLDADREALPEIWAAKGRWHDDEPLRLKLAYMRERLARTETCFQLRQAGRSPPPSRLP